MTEESKPSHQLHIDIVFDTICPRSYIGLSILNKAIESANDITFTFNYQPFFILNPKDIPPQGGLYEDLIFNEYDEEYIKCVYEDLIEQSRINNVLIATPITVYPSLNSHRIIEYCRQYQCENQMLMLIYRELFEKGKDIASVDILVELSSLLNLDTSKTRKFLESPLASKDIIDLAQESESCLEAPYFIISCPKTDVRIPLRGITSEEDFLEVFNNLCT